MLDPTKRFSDRVQNYLKYRPGYPSAIIPLLERDCGLTPESTVADIGSGTGFLSELFLRYGNRVFGVEPNAEMRAAGERLLAKFPKFTSIDATAEAITLPDKSVEFVTAGQAFHWFDPEKARMEFERILKFNGWIVILWNTFAISRGTVAKGYHEVLLSFGTDYRDVQREMSHSAVTSFFAPGACKTARFDFQQTFDWEGFKGRLLSASYAPQAGDPNHEPMLHELRRVFEANQKDHKVAFDYDTEVYYGQLRAD